MITRILFIKSIMWEIVHVLQDGSFNKGVFVCNDFLQKALALHCWIQHPLMFLREPFCCAFSGSITRISKTNTLLKLNMGSWKELPRNFQKHGLWTTSFQFPVSAFRGCDFPLQGLVTYLLQTVTDDHFERSFFASLASLVASTQVQGIARGWF